MVRNKVGGNRAKKYARKSMAPVSNKKLRVAENEDEIYAICTKMLGNCQIEVMCLDGRLRLCFIRKKFTGKNKHNNIIRVGTWIMCGLRSWESSSTSRLEKVDLLEIYTDIEKDKLMQTTNTNFAVLKKQEHELFTLNNDGNDNLDNIVDFTNHDDEGSMEMLPKKNETSSGLNLDDDEIDFDDI
jgi:initiation factor 1A